MAERRGGGEGDASRESVTTTTTHMLKAEEERSVCVPLPTKRTATVDSARVRMWRSKERRRQRAAMAA
jgi:hypothetical protein